MHAIPIHLALHSNGIRAPHFAKEVSSIPISSSMGFGAGWMPLRYLMHVSCSSSLAGPPTSDAAPMAVRVKKCRQVFATNDSDGNEDEALYCTRKGQIMQREDGKSQTCRFKAYGVHDPLSLACLMFLYLLPPSKSPTPSPKPPPSGRLHTNQIAQLPIATTMWAPSPTMNATGPYHPLAGCETDSVTNDLQICHRLLCALPSPPRGF